MRRISQGKAVGAVVGALLLVAHAVAAHHVSFGVSVSNPTAGANSSVTFSLGFGNVEPASLELQFPTGWQFAHEVGTSPLTPTPSDEEQVGSGTATARWEPFCGLSSNMALTMTWEDSMVGAPAGAVAHYTITGGLLFNTEAWVIQNGTADYDLEIPDFPDTFVCSSTTNHSWTLTVAGTTADGDKVIRNPLTTGTYQFTLVVVDVNGTTHTSNHSVAIV